MRWANFLHIYQPPTQTSDIVDRVVRESYRPILKGLIDNPTAKLTLNINGILDDLLVQSGFTDILEMIKHLLERGQIELTASAKFHPFLPNLPESEIIRQINLNNETHLKHFGSAYQPKGFFAPEMAYNDKVGAIVKKLNYQWIILDELACPQPIDPTAIFQNPDGLLFFFRDRGESNKILSASLGTGDVLLRDLAHRLDQNQYLLTAMDGETFGHHRPGLDHLLLDIYQSSKLPTITISDLITLFPTRIDIIPKSSTWATLPKELDQLPFSRWDNPANEIHTQQWQLTNLALDHVANESETVHQLVDRGLHSDQYWWASAQPWWSLEMIERGAHELLTAIQSFTSVGEDVKTLAKKLYYGIITAGFDWQRTGKVADLSRPADEDIKMKMEENVALISKSDYEEMISVLRTQMLSCAANQEYARAEVMKKRIDELSADRDKIPHDHQLDVTVNQ